MKKIIYNTMLKIAIKEKFFVSYKNIVNVYKFHWYLKYYKMVSTTYWIPVFTVHLM